MDASPTVLSFAARLHSDRFVSGLGASVSCRFEVQGPSEALRRQVANNVAVGLAIDCSASMSTSDLHAAIDAAKAIATRMRAKNTLSVVSFASRAASIIENTHTTPENQAAIASRLERLHFVRRGSTNLTQAIEVTAELLSKNPADCAKVLVVLSDGAANSPERATKAARDAARQGVQLFAVGLGHNCDKAHLQQLVALSDGTVFGDRDIHTLVDAFQQIAGRIERFVAADARIIIQHHPAIQTVTGAALVPQARSLGTLVADDDGCIHIPLGHVETGSHYAFDLDFDAAELPPGGHQLCRAQLRYVDANGQLVRVPRELRVTGIAEPTLPVVEHHAAAAEDIDDEPTLVDATDATVETRPAVASPMPSIDGSGDNADVCGDGYDDDDSADSVEGAFDVELLDPGPQTIIVIREIRHVTGSGLRRIADVVRTGSGVVLRGAPHAMARSLHQRLVRAGARVSLSRSAS